MTTIALVDDDGQFLTSLSIALEDEGYRTQTYSDSATALIGLRKTPPDVVIFDFEMLRMDGLELLLRLRQHSELPVIFLTSKVDENDELFGLKMGADDFIRKPFSLHLLMERVKAVLRRSQPDNAAIGSDTETRVIKSGKLQMDPERHFCSWDANPVQLTKIEYLILEALAKQPGIFKSRDALMDVSYGEQVYVHDRTIDSHIKRMRKKFVAVDSGFNEIETLYGVGYRLKER